MATLEKLEINKAIHRLTMRKVTPQKREVWLFPDVMKWMRDELPNLTSFYNDEQSTPIQQAYSLFGSFLRGEELYESEDFWRMKPISMDVFEFRSPDLRFFGWFNKPKVFLVVAADTFENTHKNDLHRGYLEMVVRERTKLNLDEPKWAVGAEPEDVF
ncbi:hypothetical protein [Agrobacterium tumefaciens]|uniref:hypothetical protein n=1 Tax=Agrobacterium tumefaciens TaxID=358 RepID=UPI000DD49398|nr:hypothetical protein [Agrobacterium tumefaciens]MDP9872330.1 hypothetical protein [Agrobacterium tumefaciens]MDP9975948.1 hypothetical protein [Agrobacterium tumefaciens]